MMVPIQITVPAALLRRFREVADLYWAHGGDGFGWALRTAAAEAILAHADMQPIDKPMARGPMLTVHGAVHVEAARFVAGLAGRSGLTQAEAWHVVLGEFVGREMSPPLNQEAA
jgi:hypothetical protein